MQRNEIIINFEEIKSILDFYSLIDKYLRENDKIEYFGKNLDAFWDVFWGADDYIFTFKEIHLLQGELKLFILKIIDMIIDLNKEGATIKISLE